MVRVTVIVPNYNGREHLEECLGTVLAQDLKEPFNVLLVDNGSVDDSVAFVRRRFPGVRILENGQNFGFAVACNRAVAASDTDYVVLLNNDVRVPPDWLRELVAAADEADEDVMAVGSLVLLYHYPDRVNHAGAKFAPIGGGFDVGLGARLDEIHLGIEPFPTAAASAAAALYRKKLFQGLGGFDESFFMYFEDTDLSLRAWLRGHASILAPRSVVYHKFGATSGGRDSPIRIYWGQRNRIRMAVHCFSPRSLRKAVPLIALYTLLRTTFLAVQSPRGSLEMWRATAHALRDLPGARRGVKPSKAMEDALARRGLFASFGGLLREEARLRRLRKAGIRV